MLEDAYGEKARFEDVWEKNGRYYDALRPGVEPEGLSSPDEVVAQRLNHLGHVRSLFDATELFVFTFGLTEAWVHRASGTVYPSCPGVVAGIFDPDTYSFCNFGFTDILRDLEAVRFLLKKRNPRMRFLFTVSLLPLVATASGEHVLVATTYSKSTLRAVCGAMTRSFDDVDYFPSYELVVSPFTRASFFESNLRSVTADGVASVMRVLLSAHGFNQPPSDALAPSSETILPAAPESSEIQGDNMIVLQQPELTRSGHALSKRKYSRKSVGLTPDFSLEHPPNDYFHMNRLFGAEGIKTMFGSPTAHVQGTRMSASR